MRKEVFVQPNLIAPHAGAQLYLKVNLYLKMMELMSTLVNVKKEIKTLLIFFLVYYNYEIITIYKLLF